MGLLTDPGAGQGKLTQHLLNNYLKIYVLLFFGGIIWFLLLAYPPINQRTYLSENALQPGLVKSDFKEESDAFRYHTELLDEMEKYKNIMPYPWLAAKLRQIGLEVFYHNFTLNYPLGSTKFTGKNIYGILRAPRAASTEGLVLSTPFRPKNSPYLQTTPSIALLLAFAKFASNKNYWAKDIIFLITEHEQLGIQAWLEAYHSISCGHGDFLQHGDLEGRAGAIQAAINLEMHELNIGQIDIKTEGLNGQLPNLDLFNLVVRLCSKEGIQATYKNRSSNYHTDALDFANLMRSLDLMLSQILTQSTGIPTGNHGLFHRFGIQAITLEGTSRAASGQMGLQATGRVLEGTFRSLNNLLERFHQSFFFYVLPSTERFISIGLYMPVIGALAGCLFINACGLWYRVQDNYLSLVMESGDASIERDWLRSSPVNALYLLIVLLCTHVIGALLINIPYPLASLGSIHLKWPADQSVFVGVIGFCILSAIITAIALRIFPVTKKTILMLSIACHLEYGTTLIAIGMVNFSLSFIASCIYPLILFIINCERLRLIHKIVWLFAHPVVILFAAVACNAKLAFPEEPIAELWSRAVMASRQAVTFAIVDHTVYANWLFPVACLVAVPAWLNVWCVLWARAKPLESPTHDLAAGKAKAE